MEARELPRSLLNFRVDGDRCLFQTTNHESEVVFDRGVMTFE